MLASGLRKSQSLKGGKLKNELIKLIRGCRKGNLDSQKELYRQFYGYAMGVCLRYSNSGEEAKEIVNDGFLKVFANIGNHRESSSFKAWLRRIMVNASIDCFRRNQKHYHGMDLAHVQVHSQGADSLGELTEQEILTMVQALSPAYRLAFNLYAIEGFKHHEIAAQLNISVGTSKSNLAKARIKLRKMLLATDQENFESYG